MSEKFPELAGAYFFRYYIAANTGNQDDFSRLLLRFKSGDNNAVKDMTNYVKKLDLKNYFPIKDLGMRVLGSNELIASRDDGSIPLDRILKCMPINFAGWGYLTKERETKPLKNSGNRNNRKEILHNVYRYRHNNEFESILILDDVITTGTTINEITRAIKKEVSNVKIYFFAIAKTKSKLGRDYPKLDLDTLQYPTQSSLF